MNKKLAAIHDYMQKHDWIHPYEYSTYEDEDGYVASIRTRVCGVCGSRVAQAFTAKTGNWSEWRPVGEQGEF